MIKDWKLIAWASILMLAASTGCRSGETPGTSNSEGPVVQDLNIIATDPVGDSPETEPSTGDSSSGGSSNPVDPTGR